VQHRAPLPTRWSTADQERAFTASRATARTNDRRIRVSKCQKLDDALVGTGFPFKELGRLDLYMRQLRFFMEKSSGVRRAGAAALDLAYVACGRLDAFWELGLAPWDMAAGALLIQEAGGLVADLSGEQDFMSTGDVVAATPKIFPRRSRGCCRLSLPKPHHPSPFFHLGADQSVDSWA
jgi:myo-inositol-1(or 4)-monophosphatase